MKEKKFREKNFYLLFREALSNNEDSFCRIPDSPTRMRIPVPCDMVYRKGNHTLWIEVKYTESPTEKSFNMLEPLQKIEYLKNPLFVTFLIFGWKKDGNYLTFGIECKSHIHDRMYKSFATRGKLNRLDKKSMREFIKECTDKIIGEIKC